MQFSRIAEIERGKIDLTTGRFPMVLATDGEASDGHILSIDGGQVPARMPLLISHEADPRSTAGSVIEPARARGVLRAVGEIEMGGDGPLAEIRRDMAHMIAEGHLRAVSLRWDPIEWQERSALPKDHPAHVADTAKGAKRWGLHFSKWRALEGSIVAIGADQNALIGRSQETSGPVSAFWRSLVEQEREPEGSWVPLSMHLRVCGENTDLLARCEQAEERLRALTTTPDRHVLVREGTDFSRVIAEEMAAYEERLKQRLDAWAERTLGVVR